VGVGTPGLVNPGAGIVIQAVNLGWRDLPLQEILEQRYNFAAWVANDSHMAALAEFTARISAATQKLATFPAGGPGVQDAALQRGGLTGSDNDAAISSRNLVVIRIEDGVGAGIVLDGQLQVGDHFGAGEVGHVSVDPAGPLCACGNRGCLEALVSRQAILDAVRRLALEGNPVAAGGRANGWQELISGLQREDPVAIRVVRTAGAHLGYALAFLIATLNVEHIVVAGGVVDLGEAFLEAAREAARDRVLSTMVDRTCIEFSTLGDEIVLQGCMAMVLRRELGVI
jgi:predicted NBD/HSP70 family sugar kinase